MTESRKVLIIDDDNHAAETVRAGLESLGYQVTVCESVKEVLGFPADTGFDFIITDHDTPGTKGVEVARLLRQRFPHAYLIGMSRADLCDAFLFAGANWFIHKPVTEKKLQQVFCDLRRR